MKTPILATIAAACLLSLGVARARADCLDDVRKAGVITAGDGVMGMRPYSWQNQDGTYSGFEADLFAEIGKRIGVPKTEFIITEWPTLIPGLKAERWDIILSGMAVTQERVQGAGIAFSRPYFVLYDYVSVLDKSPVHTVADLKGKTIASMLGTMDSLNAHSLVDRGEAAQVLDFNASTEAYKALRNGQADAIVLSQATLHAQQEMMHDVRRVGDPLFYQPKPDWAAAEARAPYVLGSIAVGVRKECPALLAAINGALEGMDKDGTRQAILARYGLWAEEQAKFMK